jgi:hypothetical protein
VPTVGSSAVPSTTVRPADDSTVLVLRALRGDDTVITSVPISKTADAVVDGVRQQTWTATDPVEYTVPGEWMFTWEADGTGEAVATSTVQVSPAATSGRRAYATTADLASFTGQAPPTGARQKLVEASDAVDDMLFSALYFVDSLGLPTDPAVAEAIRDATCAQAADTEIERRAAAAGSAFTIGKLSLTRPAQAAVPAPKPGVFYSAQAWRILARAGLTGHAVRTS